jgi:hypothetical protein
MHFVKIYLWTFLSTPKKLLKAISEFTDKIQEAMKARLGSFGLRNSQRNMGATHLMLNVK